MKKSSGVLAYILPQLRDLLFVSVFFFSVFAGPNLFSNDGDLGRHITVGNYILKQGVIPTSNIFSFTGYGESLVPHEWLADIIFALAHQQMGLSGVIFIVALLGSLTMLVVYRELLKRGSFRLTAFFIIFLVMAVTSVHWLARPHMFTLFFITLWTYGLERIYKKELKNIWYFPVLMLIWANTHGAFFAGFVVFGAYFANWVYEFWRGTETKELGKQLALIGALSFAVTFINPSGWHLWTTTVGYIGNDYMTSHIQDHLSPNFHEKGTWPFLLLIVFAMLALAQGIKLSLRDTLLLAGWTAMGLHTIRNLPLFAVVTAPIYGVILQGMTEKIPFLKKQDEKLKGTENFLRGYVWISVVTLLFGFALWRGVPLDVKRVGNIFLPDKMPVQAVDWLLENKQEGNMFNHFIWGGYILYRTWPTELVFIDGQTDFYGEALLRDYLDAMYVRDGWEAILDKHQIAWVIARVDDPLSKRAWRVIYRDDLAVIFRRDVVSP
jgi:hypothetical protein